MGNLPPVEPPDLRRNRRNREDDNYPPEGNYPPPDYPPEDDYPPRGGPVDLDDPQYGGAPPRRGTDRDRSYPPQDDYPPRGGPVDLDDPQYGGAPPRRGTDRDRFAERERIDLDDPRYGGRGRDRDEPHQDRGRRAQRDRPRYQDEPDLRRRREPSGGWGLSERQIEYLAWGSTVLLLGVSLIQAVTGSTGFLKFFFPLLAGAILMGASLYQRVVRGWHVGPMTWLMAILLLSYTITLMVSGDDTGIFKWIAYFFGTLIIMTGLILLLQVFRRQ